MKVVYGQPYAVPSVADVWGKRVEMGREVSAVPLWMKLW